MGPIGGPLALEMAAVLTCGNAAWISDEAAAYLFALRRERPDSVHLTSSSLMRRLGIRVHRRAIITDEVTAIDGIPVTTATRTILDLAATLSPADLEHLLAEAYAKRLTTRGLSPPPRTGVLYPQPPHGDGSRDSEGPAADRVRLS